MRTDQFPGLAPAAIKFLIENRSTPNTCPTCGHVVGEYLKEIDKFEGMIGMVHPLFRHPLKNGSYADEFVQTVPWSSGPCHFLGLRSVEDGEFLWTDEEIEEWL